MGRREKKRKSKTFLRDAIKRAQWEIDVLVSRLEKEPSSSDECRVCCLMNKTLPKFQKQLASLEQKESKQAWIQ
jgi:hypothetical protein